MIISNLKMAGIGFILITVAFGIGYFKGRVDYANNIASKQVNSIVETHNQTNNVKKDEQSKTFSEISNGLCELGIVRGNVGCE